MPKWIAAIHRRFVNAGVAVFLKALIYLHKNTKWLQRILSILVIDVLLALRWLKPYPSQSSVPSEKTDPHASPSALRRPRRHRQDRARPGAGRAVGKTHPP